MKTIFVSIGIPSTGFQLAKKVMCNVQTLTQTDIQVAKLCRKSIAEERYVFDEKKKKERHFRPSELFWMIYENVNEPEAWLASKPYLCSANAPKNLEILC